MTMRSGTSGPEVPVAPGAAATVLADSSNAALAAPGVVPRRPRDLQMYRPYRDEMPWDLLASTGADEAALEAVLTLDLVRVGKLDGRIVAAYGVRPLTPLRYELVALVVTEGYRGKGFGRWLLGHAIGLSESRGGREIVVHGQQHRRFLGRSGFVTAGSDLLLTLTPE